MMCMVHTVLLDKFSWKKKYNSQKLSKAASDRLCSMLNSLWLGIYLSCSEQKRFSQAACGEWSWFLQPFHGKPAPCCLLEETWWPYTSLLIGQEGYPSCGTSPMKLTSTCQNIGRFLTITYSTFCESGLQQPWGLLDPSGKPAFYF